MKIVLNRTQHSRRHLSKLEQRQTFRVCHTFEPKVEKDCGGCRTSTREKIHIATVPFGKLGLEKRCCYGKSCNR